MEDSDITDILLNHIGTSPIFAGNLLVSKSVEVEILTGEVVSVNPGSTGFGSFTWTVGDLVVKVQVSLSLPSCPYSHRKS